MKRLPQEPLSEGELMLHAVINTRKMPIFSAFSSFVNYLNKAIGKQQL